jgi:UrcA family protein
MMLKILPALAALALASAVVMPTIGRAADTSSVRISYADLNLASDLDRNRLRGRIAYAAEVVCGPADHRDVPFVQKVRECRTGTIADVQPSYTGRERRASRDCRSARRRSADRHRPLIR